MARIDFDSVDRRRPFFSQSSWARMVKPPPFRHPVCQSPYAGAVPSSRRGTQSTSAGNRAAAHAAPRRRPALSEAVAPHGADAGLRLDQPNLAATHLPALEHMSGRKWTALCFVDLRLVEDAD